MRPSGGLRLGRLLVLAFALLGVAAPAAAATTWNVTNTGDGSSACPSPGNCTLRGAVQAAGDGDTISVPAGTYSLSASDPIMITHSITISGAGASTTTVDGGSATRIFEIPSTSSSEVTISGLTLQHANGAGGDDPGFGGAIYNRSSNATLTIENATISNNPTSGFGGGVFNDGTLTVENSTISNNTVTTSGAAGGAIFSDGAVTITNSTLVGNAANGFGAAGGAVFTNNPLTISASVLDGNHADYNGGAIFSNNPVTIRSSTLSGNSAANGSAGYTGGGGAIWANDALSITGSTLDNNGAGGSSGAGYGGAIANNSTLTLTNSTLSHNDAVGATPYGQGGGIAMSGNATLMADTISGNSAQNQGGSMSSMADGINATLADTIIAGGSAPTASNCFAKGTYTSQGHNLEDTSPTQCGLSGPGDQVGVNPRLGQLQDNGGPTHTEALLAGSPAIDAVPLAACASSTDQRGVTRPQGSACDIGAYELAPPHATTGLASGVIVTGATIAGSAANPDAQGATYYFKYGTTTAYGAQTATQSMGPFARATPVSAVLGGLKPRTRYHFELVVVNPDGTSVGGDQTFTTTAPTLSTIKIKPDRFKTVKGSGPAIVSKGKRGAVVSYTDSVAATTTFTVLRAVRGYRSGGRCVAHRPKHASRVKRCTRWVAVGSFKHQDRAGANRFRFSGRINHRRLKKGAYRLQAIARLSGASSPKRTTGFRISG